MEDFDYEKNKTWESTCLKKYGFYIHGVLCDGYTNFHTHGVFETFKHLELQICLPLSLKTAQAILGEVVRRIRSEKVILKDGDMIDGLIDDYKCRAYQATEMKLPVIRIIFPDKDSRFPEDDDCNELFKMQIKHVDE